MHVIFASLLIYGLVVTNHPSRRILVITNCNVDINLVYSIYHENGDVVRNKKIRDLSIRLTNIIFPHMRS